MSDLVLGLLVLGVCLFAGVLIYNRWQERSAKRAAERAFGSRHADALMDEPAPRREPSIAPKTLPDERVDYVMELKGSIAAPLMLEGWRPIEQRFGRRALLAQAEDGSWRAALQIVSRAGVVSDAELIEFRSEVETLGAKLGATFAAPGNAPGARGGARARPYVRRERHPGRPARGGAGH